MEPIKEGFLEEFLQGKKEGGGIPGRTEEHRVGGDVKEGAWCSRAKEGAGTSGWRAVSLNTLGTVETLSALTD